jgi:hypothetical protein
MAEGSAATTPAGPPAQLHAHVSETIADQLNLVLGFLTHSAVVVEFLIPVNVAVKNIV